MLSIPVPNVSSRFNRHVMKELRSEVNEQINYIKMITFVVFRHTVSMLIEGCLSRINQDLCYVYQLCCASSRRDVAFVFPET